MGTLLIEGDTGFLQTVETRVRRLLATEQTKTYIAPEADVVEFIAAVTDLTSELVDRCGFPPEHAFQITERVLHKMTLTIRKTIDELHTKGASGVIYFLR